MPARIAFAKLEVVAAAPDAPDEYHNIACVVLAGYLYDAPPSKLGNAWANSGAAFILRRYLIRRAVPAHRGDGMTWPWQRAARTEQRAGSVTDSVIAELQRRAAGGSSGDPSSDVRPYRPRRESGRAASQRRPCRLPAAPRRPCRLRFCTKLGRDLVLSGQSVLQFGVHAGRADAAPPCRVRLGTGSPDPATWRYSAALHRPDP